MNALELLISALNRPEPTDKLDARIKALLAQVELAPRRRRWKSALLSCGTAACVGLLGFYAGRLSASSATDPLPAKASASRVQPRSESAPVAASVTKIPLGEDQLAGLFVRPDHRESLLGSGPVTVLTSASP
jgi:hypothetical protein